MATVDELLVEFLALYPFQPATAWWRAVEVAHLLRAPIPAGLGLDVGCGDGLLTALVARHLPAAPRRWVGLDPDPAEVALAARSGLYTDVLTSAADRIEQPAGRFDFAVSNSVLEHIADPTPVLHEVARVLKPGAPFVFTVPSDTFRDCLRGPSPLRRMLLGQDRAAYVRAIDQRVAHRTYWSADGWRDALAAAGFAAVDMSSYLSAPEVQRWETVSNLTAGLLHEVLGRRPPIEIQRSFGLRRAQRMPRPLARLLARVLRSGVRQDTAGLYGGLLVVAQRSARD